mmetsp:Transcript_2428/g.5481  ORF Transcript_2428/g.5481 Transcript_2428/m.5481 type:complete len:140 (-) Transcript_2428:303-722(-)
MLRVFRSCAAMPGRALCTDADAAAAAALELFLKNISRPKMGQAKAKQSAGQRAVDLTKQLNKLKGLTVEELTLMSSAELKRRGLPTQERKRIISFGHKLRTGWEHDGLVREKHAWKGWRAPQHDLRPPSESRGTQSPAE